MKNRNEIEELIVKYFSNEITEAESLELLGFLNDNPGFKNEFLKYKNISDAVFSSLNNIEFDAKQAYNSFIKKLNKIEKKETKVIPLIRWASVVAVAASIIIAWLLFKPVQQTGMQTVAEEIKNIELPDGSKIALNENSKITYPKKFKNKRHIQFEGEAFFEIEPNPEKPFIAEMDRIIIEVKGTSFNVKQDSVAGFIEVAVKTGEVKVQNKISYEFITLNEGEKAEYDYLTNTIRKFENKSQNDNSWQTGILIFEDAPLKEVIKDLTNYYKVDIEMEDTTISNCKLDTKIDNVKFDEVIDMLELIFKFEIIEKDNKYIIKGEGC